MLKLNMVLIKNPQFEGFYFNIVKVDLYNDLCMHKAL